ncbi:MAG: SGNH/GDSL hydrolase family protein [Rhodobacteraceae bacterium]|nr:SGNH/GDSL hydrolase family protein [Paracoccaceae bacterium]
MRLVFIFIAALWAGAVTANEPRIQLLGDSLMSWNMLTGRSVPMVLSDQLGEKIINRSRTGAMFRAIARQYRPGNHEWVVLNGGGNDLWLGCGCTKCAARMAQIISPDGMTGELPELVSRIRANGARVLYVGYLRSPDFGSPIEHCRDDGDEMERRVALMAGRMDGVWLVSNKEVVPPGDKSFHAFDRIHPSPKGSRVIGKRIASAIRQLDKL